MNFQKAVELGQDWATELGLLQQFLEGPLFLRTLSGIAGLALAAGVVATSLDILKLHDPPQLVLKIYTILFGMAVFVNECKSGSTANLEAYRQWVFKWFPFLSVMAGKGVFMLFVGAVGLAYHEHYLVAIPAAIIAAVGLLYLFTHLSKRQEMTAAIDKSMNLAASSIGGFDQRPYIPQTHPYSDHKGPAYGGHDQHAFGGHQPAYNKPAYGQQPPYASRGYY